MTKATIYARYSSLEQAKGSSLARQISSARAYCDAESLTVDNGDVIKDEGRSAYSGANRRVGGRLWAFEQRVAAGEFANEADADGKRLAGRFLVCEHLDRISRQGWEEVYSFLQKMTTNGVSVVTTIDNTIYPAFKRVQMADIITIIVRAEAAWKQSEDKSLRVADAHARKVRAAMDGDRRAITLLTPAWIDVDPLTREMKLNRHRVRVLRQIYKWCAEGMGSPMIVRRLNERGEDVWGSGKRKAKNGWQLSYVSKLLTNRAVLGEYQPMARSRKANSAIPKGDCILNYYPQAIDAALFDRVQAERKARRGHGGRRGGQRNLFSGFAKCRVCGGRMAYGSTRKAGNVVNGTNGSRKPITYIAGTDHSFLQCDNARRRVRTAEGEYRCGNLAKIRYEFLERTVLKRLLHLALDDTFFARDDQCGPIASQIADLKRQVADKKKRLAAAAESYTRTGMAAMEQIAMTLTSQISAEVARLTELESDLARMRGQVSPEEHLSRLATIMDAIEDPDDSVRCDARVRVHQALGSIITSIVCSEHRTSEVTVAHGLARLTIDAQGKIAEPENRRHLRTYTKEYQLDGLAAHDGNAHRISAIRARMSATSPLVG